MSFPVIAISVIVLADWVWGIIAIPQLFPALATMKFNTALCLFALGIAVFLLPPEGMPLRRASALSYLLWGLAITAGLLALVTLVEYATGISLGIDELFVRDPTSTCCRGRMAPSTALSIAGSAFALLFLLRSSQATAGNASAVRVAHALATVPAAIGYLGLTGYAYDIAALYSFGPFTSMALPTALSLFFLSLGILGTFPSLGWRAPFESRPVALKVLTTLMPLALIAPLLFGAAIVFGAHTDFYSFGLVPSFFALATATLAVALSLFAANVVRVAEGRLIELETALRESNRRKDEFLASLAHELRNPLASFRSGVYVLRKLDPQMPEAKKLLPIMERRVDHLIRLVDDLLDVSRITRGKIHIRKERATLSISCTAQST
jgi:hypothetical protein